MIAGRRACFGLLLGVLAATVRAEPPDHGALQDWAREIAARHRAIAAETVRSSGAAEPADVAAAIAERRSRGIAAGEPPGPPATGRPQDGPWLFVSRSLGQTALREIFATASREGMTVVFRGIPEGTRLAEGLRDLQEMAGAFQPPPAVILDPGMWRDWGVADAPTLVMVENHKPVARVRGLSDPAWLRGALAAGERGDLGLQGPVREPSEPDLIGVLRERAGELDFAALKARALARYWERVPMHPLPRAQQDSQRAIDLSVSVQRDIRTSTGAIVARAGQVIDPLAARPFTLRLVVFDATRSVEVAFARRQVAERPNAVLIATQLDRERRWDGLRDLEASLDRPVYLLGGDLRDRFGLRRTPSVVEACAPRGVCVREFALSASTHPEHTP